MSKLFLLLEAPNPIEKRLGPLEHDGGKLLRMLIDRLSIPREAWLHDYCSLETKAMLKEQIKDVREELALERRRLGRKTMPSAKVARGRVMDADAWRIKEQLKLSRPCVIVGMGGLACEMLTGASLVNTRAGTCWETMGYGKVWITNSPDAALFDPRLAVDITGVLANAAKMARIETKFNINIPMFDWEPYEHQRVPGL